MDHLQLLLIFSQTSKVNTLSSLRSSLLFVYLSMRFWERDCWLALLILHSGVLLAHSAPLILIYLSEVVFRDVPCHSSARPIKHTVMTDWPRSKLITDWLTERVALFCSAVLAPICQTFQAQGNFKCGGGVFPCTAPLRLALKVTWIWILPLLPVRTYWWWSLRSTERDYNSECRSEFWHLGVALFRRLAGKVFLTNKKDGGGLLWERRAAEGEWMMMGKIREEEQRGRRVSYEKAKTRTVVFN